MLVKKGLSLFLEKGNHGNYLKNNRTLKNTVKFTKKTPWVKINLKQRFSNYSKGLRYIAVNRVWEW